MNKMAESERHLPSVLLGFNGENIRSFRDPFDVSLLATRQSRPQVPVDVPWREDGATVSVLPTVGFFGPNASGKTNVLRFLDDMRSMVLHSFRHGDPAGGLDRQPFRLDPNSRGAPSSYEVDLIVNGVRHVYGFILDDERVLEEWAFHYPKGRPKNIFRRDGDNVEFGASDRGKARSIKSILRPNALVLSTAASANHSALLPLYAWFSRNLLLADVRTRNARQVFSARLLDEDSRLRDSVLSLMKSADLGITGARREEPDPAFAEKVEKAMRVLISEELENNPELDVPPVDTVGVALTHRGADQEVEFPFEDESLGTLVWFGLVGPVIQALSDGAVLLADELDASIHPALAARVVELFQNHETNPNRAQLLFNSHDVSMLGEDSTSTLLGRDQVWFTEKHHEGATRIYPLSDFGPRKDEAIAKRYLAGRYGAVPILDPAEFAESARQSVIG